ncbi:amino acid ABC transporter substrate-binding protein [Pantoea sp. KPR_PJ]|uniref:amino acid ABC transporter substrate-binding protein n=1 Tax=Pantoea sp. KPR_PJ TaxID=2738375 RepID=UPI003526F1A0
MQKGLIALSIVMAASLLSACDNNTSAQEDDNATTIRVGATGLSFPGAFKKDGKLTGFDVDVTEAIAKDLNYNIEWVTSDFSGLMGQLEGGKLDTVANVVAITPARQEKYHFSTPYSYYGSQIVTGKGNTNINTLDDLRGKTIAGVLGSNHLVNLKKAFGDNGVTIRTYESRDGAMNDAINNRVQGYVNSGPILLAEINQKGLPLKFVGEPLVIESVGFPFHKDEKGDKLRAAFDKEVEAMRKDGRLKAISEKYFGEDITSAPSE